MLSRTLLLRRSTRAGAILLAAFIILGTYSLHEVTSKQNGVAYQSQVGCGGFQCHSPTAAPSTVVTILNTNSKIETGKTYTMQISVKNPTASIKAGGCDVSVDLDALIAPADTGLHQLDDGLGGFVNEVTHTWPRPFKTTDSAVWTFTYTAPSTPGTAHIYAGGNAVDYNGLADNGDMWNKTVYTLNVVKASSGVNQAVATSDVSVSLFPNPATDKLSISSPRASGVTSYSVIAADGKVLSRGSLARLDGAELDIRALASGSYFLHLTTADGNHIVHSFAVKH